MKGLNQEHEELLRDLMQTDAWPAVLNVAELIVQRQALAVLKHDLNQGSRGLIILKARHEGAQALVAALHSLKKDLKMG